MSVRTKVDLTRLDDLIDSTPIHGRAQVGRDLLVSIRTAITERQTLPHDLGLAIASAIARSAGVALAAHRVPRATRLAAEVGNNCAHTVVLMLEAFLEDGTIMTVQREPGKRT